MIILMFPVQSYAYEYREKVSYIEGTLEEQANSKEIIKAAEILKECNKSVNDTYFVYLFVKDYIEYDFDKFKNRENYTYNAVTALKERKGTCVDFSLLYAALCRAMGYECNIVVSLNGAHARNEVYDGRQWVQVDCAMEYYKVTDEYEPYVTYKIK